MNHSRAYLGAYYPRFFFATKSLKWSNDFLYIADHIMVGLGGRNTQIYRISPLWHYLEPDHLSFLVCTHQLLIALLTHLKGTKNTPAIWNVHLGMKYFLTKTTGWNKTHQTTAEALTPIWGPDLRWAEMHSLILEKQHKELAMPTPHLSKDLSFLTCLFLTLIFS